MTLTIYNNTSNVKKANKELDVIGSLENIDCTLKAGCSVQRPTILLRRTVGINKNMNYFYITELDRWYFITNIDMVRHDLIEITGRTDVLTTAYKRKDSNNKSRLGKCRGILKRSEKSYNLYLDDGSLRVYNKPHVITKSFPSGFSTPEFVLAMSGN